MAVATPKKQKTLLANMAELHYHCGNDNFGYIDFSKIDSIMMINPGKQCNLRTTLVKNKRQGIFEGRSRIVSPDVRDALPIKLPLIQFNPTSGSFVLRLNLGVHSILEHFDTEHDRVNFASTYLRYLGDRVSAVVSGKNTKYSRTISWGWLEKILDDPEKIWHRNGVSEEAFEVVTDTPYEALAELQRRGVILRVKLKVFNGVVKEKVSHWVIRACGVIDVYDEHNTSFHSPDRQILIEL